MSVTKTISTLPDTKQTLDDNVNYAYTSGYFVTEKKTLFTSLDEIKDFFEWQDLMESNDLTPLHSIKKLEYINEETFYQESLQDRTYPLREGKRREKAYFIWNIDKHTIVDQLSGTDLYIIKYDRNNNVYLVQDDDGFRGVKTNLLQLEKMMEATESEPAFSPFFVEYAEKFNTVVDAEFQLSEIDRLYMSINIEYLDSDTLNFSATYNGQPLSDYDIDQSDISIDDINNGDLEPDFYSYSGGVFQLKNFEAPLTNGIMTIISTLYMGCIAYRVRVVVAPITTNNDFEDAVNYDFQDSVNYDFET